MKKNYQFVFFDLDHTLWDYDRNAEETLLELHDRYDLERLGSNSAQDFFQHFLEVNDELWSQYNLGKISKYVLRNERFEMVLERSGVKNMNPQLVTDFGKDYLAECPLKEAVVEGTEEILKYLEKNYRLFIITNGFEETQKQKLESSNILEYFDEVITSERAGSKKPANGIFQYSMKHCEAVPDQSIFIGDNLQTDMKGARDFGMDHVFYNPKGIAPDVRPTYEISHLSALEGIL